MNVRKHYGPGPHKNGTEQSIHGKKGGAGLTYQMMSQEKGQRGYSYDRKNNRFASEGFALSVFPQFESVVPVDAALKEAVDAYVEEHVDKVREDERIYFGAWLNEEDGRVYLDLSIVVDDRDEAISLAHDYQQEGIYDLAAGETIYTRARPKDDVAKRLSRPSPPAALDRAAT